MIRAFLLTLLFFFSLQAKELYLKDNLEQAKVGDYVVTSQNRTYTLLLIAAKSEQTIYLEEISIPEGRISHHSWREWVEGGAKGSTSWVGYEISPREGKLLECYSFTQQAWCEFPGGNSFLTTLLNMRLTPLETKFRRHTRSGDHSRGYWQPRLTVNGEIVPGAQFTAYCAKWPGDGSELAGKQIELYLPAQEGSYPSYLPYWLQVSGAVGKARMRIVDSGSGLIPPHAQMPMRPLAFINSGTLEQKELILLLKTRPYYRDLHLVAIEVREKRQIPLSFSLQQTDQFGVVVIKVPEQELAAKLTSGASYRFLIAPWRQPAAAAKTVEPLRWEP